MKAILLAAGRSTRLYPLTAELPKCLLPVGGKAVLDHQLEALVAAGIPELVIVVGFHKEKIMDHVARARYPITVTYIENERYADTTPAHSLLLALDHLGEPVIFFHCDVLFTPDALKQLLASSAPCAMLYRAGHWDEEAGKIAVDAQGRVRELGKHIPPERSTGEYLQIAKLDAEFTARLADALRARARAAGGYTIDAFNDVVQEGSVAVAGIPYDGVAMEIDTPEDYAAAEAAWEK